MSNRKVLDPPPGYVAGVGRGALAFTTRADLGGSNKSQPISSAATVLSAAKKTRIQHKTDIFGDAPLGYVAGRGRGATGFSAGVSRDDASTNEPVNELAAVHYDEFAGYAENLFKDTEYDEEDVEADSIYDKIEEQMDLRRKDKREAMIKEELKKLREDKLTINQHFSDIKSTLKSVTKEEWESIPEIGDYSLRTKKKKLQSHIRTPDNIILDAKNQIQIGYKIDPRVQSDGVYSTYGMKTPLGIDTSLNTPLDSNLLPLTDLGEARGTVLSVKLDKVMDSVSGQTNIDPKGYLTNLELQQNSSDLANLKRARILLKSVTQTNATHAPAWIAAARIEEIAGRMKTARQMIAMGCQSCPKNEDIWLEAVRLEKLENAKILLTKGLQALPYSMALWNEAVNLQKTDNDKKKVLMKALEYLPNSVNLWKQLISLQQEDDAKVLLLRAVECVPQSVELWLALVRLCDYNEAKTLLNKARGLLPFSVDIWIAASQLEETHGHVDMIDIIINRCVQDLTSRGVSLEREGWLKYACDSETDGFIKTCQAIVKYTIKIGVEDLNMKRIWKEDALNALSKGFVNTARAIYMYALENITTPSLWLRLVELERKFGNAESLEEVLKKGVASCPDAEILWLMAAKQKWHQGDVARARLILSEAFAYNVNAESIYLAAIKLEKENLEFIRAAGLLDKAREEVGSPKVWVKSIQLERQLKHFDRAIQLSNEGVLIHPLEAKLHILRGQLQIEESNNYDKALFYFEFGLKKCPSSVKLWLCAVDIYILRKEWNLARALLEKARLANGKDEMLWYASIQLEMLSESQMVNLTLAKSLQECPSSGILWAQAIEIEEKHKKLALAVDALKKCENNENATLAIAKVFWEDFKFAKALRGFDYAVRVNPKFGDGWGTFFVFSLDTNNSDLMNNIIKNTEENEPNEGIKWNKIIKQVNNWNKSWKEKLFLFAETYYPSIYMKKKNLLPIANGE